MCGDGVVDGDEECDDGNASNTDACTDACMHAVCGDGYIWSGIEECDDGNTQGGDECDASCQSEARHVFVTDETYNGALGGLAGADQKCQASASAANLPGSYYAWVSASDGSPSSRFSRSTVPYRLPDGTIVADSWADLTDGTLSHAIDRTASGALVGGTTVWTGTNAQGAPTGTNCLDWTSDNSIQSGGRTGDAATTGVTWTDNSNNGCAAFASVRLYCFEQ